MIFGVDLDDVIGVTFDGVHWITVVRGSMAASIDGHVTFKAAETGTTVHTIRKAILAVEV